MDNNSSYWFLGVKLDKNSENPDDKIEIIDFYNNYNKKVYMHFNTSYKKEGKFIFEDYQEDSFDHWKLNTNLVIPLSSKKIEMMKEINTANQKSLRKFLKAFGFEEYII